jgi:RNA recognition motif-containing protein
LTCSRYSAADCVQVHVRGLQLGGRSRLTNIRWQVAACTSTKCFFGNLSFKIDDDSFKAEVEPKIGKVVSIQWMTDRETQQFRGSGIIEFTSTDDAGKAALLEGEGFEIMGRPVRTRLWEERAKADRPVRENKLSERPENCTTVFAGNLSYDIDDDKVRARAASPLRGGLLRSGAWSRKDICARAEPGGL